MQPIQKERFDNRIRDWANDDPGPAPGSARDVPGPAQAPAGQAARAARALAAAAPPIRGILAAGSRAATDAEPVTSAPRAPALGAAAGQRALRVAAARSRWCSSPPSRSSPSSAIRPQRLAAPPAAGLGARGLRAPTSSGSGCRGGQTLPMKTWQHPRGEADGGAPGRGPRAASLRARAAGLAAAGLGFAWALVDRDRQFLHDRLAGTATGRALAHLRAPAGPAAATSVTISTGTAGRDERRPVVEQAHVREEAPGEVEPQPDEDAEDDLQAHAAGARADRARTGSPAPSSRSPPPGRAACSRTRSRSAWTSAGSRAGAAM